MPVAKIHVLEGRYDEHRLSNVSRAVQEALIGVLKIPPDDFFQIIHELPRNRFLHTPSFLGMKYSDDFIVLELAFISGRPQEIRLALLKELNARVAAGAGTSPDHLMIQLSQAPGENFSFGQGLAQRAAVGLREASHARPVHGTAGIRAVPEHSRANITAVASPGGVGASLRFGLHRLELRLPPLSHRQPQHREPALTRFRAAMREAEEV